MSFGGRDSGSREHLQFLIRRTDSAADIEAPLHRSRSARSSISGKGSKRTSGTGHRGSFLQGVIAVGIFAILASLIGVVLAFSWVEGMGRKSEGDNQQPWLRTFEGYMNKRGNAVHDSLQKSVAGSRSRQHQGEPKSWSFSSWFSFYGLLPYGADANSQQVPFPSRTSQFHGLHAPSFAQKHECDQLGGGCDGTAEHLSPNTDESHDEGASEGSSLPDSTTTHGTEQEEQQGGEVEENQSIEEPEVPLLEPVVEAVEQTQPEVETIAGGADEVNSAESTPKVPEVVVEEQVDEGTTDATDNVTAAEPPPEQQVAGDEAEADTAQQISAGEEDVINSQEQTVDAHVQANTVTTGEQDPSAQPNTTAETTVSEVESLQQEDEISRHRDDVPQDAENQSVETQGVEPQNIESQRDESQNAESQNAESQKAESQNAESQMAGSQDPDAQQLQQTNQHPELKEEPQIDTPVEKEQPDVQLPVLHMPQNTTSGGPGMYANATLATSEAKKKISKPVNQKTHRIHMLAEGLKEIQSHVPFYERQHISLMMRQSQSLSNATDDEDHEEADALVEEDIRPKTAAARKDMYLQRRQSIRDTWLPALAALPNVEYSFVVSRPYDKTIMQDIREEERALGGPFMVLETEECYRCLPDKTLAFFMLVHKRYNAKWVAKIDDDVYLTPNRLLRVLTQWDSISADYVGCMKTNEVISVPSNRWYEPREVLLGEEYFLHAFGSFYVVSGHSVDKWIVPNAHMLRKLSNEDVSVGMWMLMFNSTFFEDRRLCHSFCDRSAIAVLSPACQGLCRPPEDMRSYHEDPLCTDPNAPGGTPFALNGTADGDGSTDGISQPQQKVQQVVDNATQETQDSSSDWLEEVLWKLPSAPWYRHEIFGMMQEGINAPGADWL